MVAGQRKNYWESDEKHIMLLSVWHLYAIGCATSTRIQIEITGIYPCKALHIVIIIVVVILVIVVAIILRKCFHVIECLCVLGEQIQIKNEGTNLLLLVVDSFSSLITPVLGGKGSYGKHFFLKLILELWY